MIPEDKLFDVKSEIVVLTGVSGQLGLEYAKTFLERGSVVIGLDINDIPNDHSIKLNFSDRYHFFQVDITKKKELVTCSKNVLEKIGIPTVLINNAALDSPPSSTASDNGPFEEYPETSFDKVMDVNVKGVFLCCQVFGSIMAKHLNGSIINVSSIYGLLSPDQSLYQYRRDRGEQFFKPVAYSVSKSSILNLTRYLAVYWAKKNVRVNSITIAGVFNSQDSEFLNNYNSRIPIGRMANQDEYNGSMVYLASKASKYMTGSNLVIDGGWTAI